MSTRPSLAPGRHATASRGTAEYSRDSGSMLGLVRSWVRVEAPHAAAAILGLGVITAVCFSWLHLTNATTVALSYLLLILFIAAASRLWVALATSVAAALALDYFFLPPIGTLSIDAPDDWIALFAFIVVSFVASHLSSVARARERELRRLFHFSRDALLEADADSLRGLAAHLSSQFGLRYVGIFLPHDAGFERHETGTLAPSTEPSDDDLRRVTGARDDSRDRVVRFAATDPAPVQLLPLRRGPEAIGVLALAGRPVEPATLSAVASVVAIAVERVRLLEHRERTELARRSVEIKSALLASLGHDLNTPLTAIGTAVRNLKVATLSDEQRSGQVEIALTGLQRLARLFRNILEMARIDAGGITVSLRWVHPYEVIHAAREQVDLTLRRHQITIVDRSGERVVNVDARLLATALAHLLENAAHYSPAGSTIRVTHEIVAGGLSLSVADQGPGIAPSDVAHIFDRFSRGSQAHLNSSGTGMGLAIVRGLIVAQGGGVWVERREEGGARFSMFVPAPSRGAGEDEE